MADFDMWGPAASGGRLVEFDRLKGAQMLGEIAMQPLKMDELRSQTEQQRAHAQLFGAQAEKLKTEAAQEAQLAELIKRAGGQATQQSDLAGQFENLANLTLGAGLTKKAEDFAKVASGLRLNSARTGNAATTAELHLLQSAERRNDMLASLLTGVTTPEGWETAKQMYTMQTGEPSPYASVPFPGVEAIQRIQQGAISAKDQATQAITEARHKQRKDFEDERLRQHEQNLRLSQERNRIAREREERLKKGGGGNKFVRPSKAEIDQADRLLKNDEALTDLPKNERDDAAFDIANEARQMMRTNPALDAGTAIRQAYLKKKTSGEFETTQGLLGSPIGRKTKYVRGKTPEISSLPADRSKWVIGQYYRNANGQVGKYLGAKGFQPMNPARVLSTDNAGADDTADDNEEGDNGFE